MAENKRIPNLEHITGISISDLIPLYDASGDITGYVTIQEAKTFFTSTTNKGILDPVANIAALKAINTTNAALYPNFVLIVVGNKGVYYLVRSSTLPEDSINYTVVAPNVGPGRWIKDQDAQSSITYDSSKVYDNSGLLESSYAEFSFKFYKYINSTPTDDAAREVVLGDGQGYPFNNVYWSEVSKTEVPTIIDEGTE